MAFAVGALARVAYRFLVVSKIAAVFKAVKFGQQTIHLDSDFDSIKFSVDGLKEVQMQLKEIEKTLRSTLVRTALMKGIKIIEKDAKQRVPVRTGTLKKAIKSRIEYRGSEKETLGFEEYAFSLYVEHGRNAQNDGYYGRFIEFGTDAYTMPEKNYGSRTKPFTDFKEKGKDAKFFGTNIQMKPRTDKQKFMRPAIDSKRKQAVVVFRDELRKEIRKAARKHSKGTG